MGAVFSSVAYSDEKCPVDHKNMSKEDLGGMMEQYKRLGHAKFASQHVPSKASTSDTLQTQSEKEERDCEVDHNDRSEEQINPQDAGADKCPVDHKNMSKDEITEYMNSQKRASKAGSKEKGGETVYDVYGQELDKSNLMPATPNQLPSPGQRGPLSTDRVKSSIPKSGSEAEETWTYPSPQMFYNALKRKGKADGVQEDDMNTVVSVHNSMNERTWREVMEWEQRFHCDECENPKLKQFMGRPHDISPAARFRTWFRGYPMPFDRHDWVIDRCGKAEARYIIDYYYREGPDPIEIHVRPAVDTMSAAFDRVRHGAMFVRTAVLGQPQQVLDTRKEHQGIGLMSTHGWRGDQVVSGESLDKEEFAFLSNLTPNQIQDISKDVQKRCGKIGEAFRNAGNDPLKFEQANMSVNYCMAQRICKTQATEFMEALENKGDETGTYEKMTGCLERFHIMARRALLEAAGVAQSGPEYAGGVAPLVGANSNPSVASRVEGE